MAWIKKEEEVVVEQEMEFGADRINVTDAYAVKITEAYLANSQESGSKSVSVYIAVENEEGETAKSRFTIMGRDGNTFFESTVKGKKVKKQHFGLNIVNTLFMIALDKEIFDCEPAETEYTMWNKDEKEMEKHTGDGFPELVGKEIGITWQMKREIEGADSREYGEITHFFDTETGLFAGEEESGKTKLDKWMNSKKDFIVKTIEATERKSSFGKKKDDAETEGAEGAEKPKKRWGR